MKHENILRVVGVYQNLAFQIYFIIQIIRKLFFQFYNDSNLVKHEFNFYK